MRRAIAVLIGALGCRGEPSAPAHTAAIPSPATSVEAVVDAAPIDSGTATSADAPAPLPAVTELAKLDNQPEAFEVTAKGDLWILLHGDPKLWIQRLPSGTSKPEDFGSEARGPGALRVDGNDVVWFSDQAHVVGWSRDGGKPRRVQVPTARAISDVMVRDGALYYLTHPPTKTESAPWSKDGTLTRVALDSGASTVLASGIPGPTALGADATSLYFWSRGDGKLHALTGGKDSIVWSAAPIVTGPGLEGWQPSNDAMRPWRFLSIEPDSFWFVDGLGAQFELSRKTGDRTPRTPPAFHVDAKWVYWVDGPKIVRRPRAGGPTQTLVQETSSKPLAPPPPIEHVTLAGGRLYWVTENGTWTHKVWSIVLPP